MFGELSKSFVSCVRDCPEVISANASVVLGVDEGGNTPNTSLPAISIRIDNSLDSQVFVGGMINDRFEVVISIISDLINYSVTNDNNAQFESINLCNYIRNFIWANRTGSYFTNVMNRYNFSPMYKGFETYQTQAFKNDISQLVIVHELRFICNMVDYGLNNDINPTVRIEEVDITDTTDDRDDRETKYYISNFRLKDDNLLITNLDKIFNSKK